MADDLRDQIAEALALDLNGPASDGRGWYRTAADRIDCYRRADRILSAVVAPELERLRTAEQDAETALDDARTEAKRLRAELRRWDGHEALTSTLIKQAEAERDALKAALEDQRAAKKTAADAVDRFRDVVADVLGYPDDNPGDDVLIAELREHFGKTGPEPTNWRDRLVGYEAARDQINAAALDHPTDTTEETP